MVIRLTRDKGRTPVGLGPLAGRGFAVGIGDTFGGGPFFRSCGLRGRAFCPQSLLAKLVPGQAVGSASSWLK